MNEQEDAETYRYGNYHIGRHDTRHEAVGAAAIRARKDPFPFGEDFEHRSWEERRRDILRKIRWVYTFKGGERVDR